MVRINLIIIFVVSLLRVTYPLFFVSLIHIFVLYTPSDFSCAVETTMLLHGRMYVTNNFLCFYSNLFGVEKKIRIPFSHITLITKENTALVIPNAIAITTSTSCDLICFPSFFDWLYYHDSFCHSISLQVARNTCSGHFGIEMNASASYKSWLTNIRRGRPRFKRCRNSPHHILSLL